MKLTTYTCKCVCLCIFIIKYTPHYTFWRDGLLWASPSENFLNALICGNEEKCLTHDWLHDSPSIWHHDEFGFFFFSSEPSTSHQTCDAVEQKHHVLIQCRPWEWHNKHYDVGLVIHSFGTSTIWGISCRPLVSETWNRALCYTPR